MIGGGISTHPRRVLIIGSEGPQFKGKPLITRTPCYYFKVKNVTITLDEETAAWARVHAARHDMSVSRLVGEMLQREMRESRGYDEAMRRFLAKAPVDLKGSGQGYASRDELHDRPRLR